MKLLRIGASGRQEEVEVPGVGAAVGDWQAYTPPYTQGLSSLGSGGAHSWRYRREGDSIHIRGVVTVGTGGTITSAIRWSLPTGLTLDATKFPGDSAVSLNLGTGIIHDSGLTVRLPLCVKVVDGENDKFECMGQTDAGAFGIAGASNFPQVWAAGDQIYVDMVAPILQWSSNVALATDFVEYVSCDGTEASSGVAANTTYTPATTNRLKTGSLFPAVAISATNSQTITTYNLDFQTPILDSDKIFIEVSVGNDVWLPLVCGMGTLSQYSQAKGVHTGMLLNRTSTNNKRISVGFSNAGTRPGTSYGTGQNTWSEARTNGWKWRVTKIGGRFSENGTDSYSTGETLTNKTWIDGKPIYRKVVSIGALPNTAIKSVAHGISGATYFTFVGGVASGGSVSVPLPHSTPSGVQYGVGINVNGSNIDVTTGVDRSSWTGYAFLEYTK